MASPSKKELDQIRWLLERLQASEQYCDPYFERAKRHYRLYRFGSAVNEDDWPYINRCRSRDILAFIEDSTAIMMSTLFAQTPFFSIIPRKTSRLLEKKMGIDCQAMGQQIGRCLDYQIGHEETEFFEEVTDLLKSGGIFGNGYMGVYPKFDEKNDYYLPLLKAIDFWDVMPIAGARRVSKARGIFLRDWVDIEAVKELGKEKVYKNTDMLRSPLGTTSDSDKNWHKSLLEEVGMAGYDLSSSDIEVMHYFSGGHVITFGDRAYILRDSNEKEKPFPYAMPIVQYKYIPVPLEFFAMGVPEILEALQEDKNLIRSARRDNIDLVINKILKIRDGANIQLDLIKWYAGAIWPVENLADIDEMDMRDVTGSSYQEETMRQHDMENALSLFGYARGMTPENSEQPTTVMKLQQASLNRLDLAVKLAEFTTLQEIARKIIMLTRRYMRQDLYETIIGEPDAGFYRVEEADIQRFFYFKPVGSSVSNIKEVRQQQMQMAFQMALGIDPMMRQNNVEPYTLNLYEAEKSMYQAVDIQNIDRILLPLPTDEELAQEEQRQALEQGGMPNMQQAQDLMQVPYGGGE